MINGQNTWKTQLSMVQGLVVLIHANRKRHVTRHTKGLIIRIKLVIPAKEEHSLRSKKALYFCCPVSDSNSELHSQVGPAPAPLTCLGFGEKRCRHWQIITTR